MLWRDRSSRSVRFALYAAQIGAHIGGGLIAHRAIFFERFVDDALEFGRYRGIQTDRRNGSAIQNSFENYAGSRAGKGRCAGGHFVENGAEREEIGAAIEFAAANLLGRHGG